MASTVATTQCPQPSLLFTHQGGWSLINNRRGTRGTVVKCRGGELGSNPGVSASEAPALGASHLPLCFLHAGLQIASLKPRKCAFRSALAFSLLCFGKRFAKRLADPRPEPRWARDAHALSPGGHSPAWCCRAAFCHHLPSARPVCPVTFTEVVTVGHIRDHQPDDLPLL